MQPFDRFPPAWARRIRFVLSDVDDTLTEGPRLPAATYAAVECLHRAGIAVIPVTAAPAGWCDLIARMWPVAAVIGENGGLCFDRAPGQRRTRRHYWVDDDARRRDRNRLAALGETIRAAIPAAALADDQTYRETTLAFAYEPSSSEAIRAAFTAAGARSIVNSLWVLGWFGAFDKLEMARRILRALFATDIAAAADTILYVGDSLNDAPMFGFFPHSVGVASVVRWLDRLPAPPRWVTRGGGGAGFVEVAEALIAARG